MFDRFIRFSAVLIFWVLCIYEVGGRSDEGIKLLNNQPLRSFKDDSGQVFHCVDIYKQPALSHPLLKNHKIQIRPSSYPKGKMHKEADLADTVEEMKMNGPTCPEGTVPIRRINKKKNLKTQHDSSRQSIAQTAAYNYAVMQIDTQPNVKYYGAHAFVEVYNPKTFKGQYSKSMIWLQNGEKGPHLNYIQAGLMVNPGLYGDNRTRFFTQWTADNNHRTGCYDKFCAGFVQVDPGFGPGMIVPNISTIEATHYYYKVLLHQDRTTGNWWLQVGHGYAHMGYFPKAIFTTMKDFATQVAWGGEVHTDLKDLGSPEMGSGLLADEGLDKAASFSVFEVVDESGNRQAPKQEQCQLVATSPKCYNIAIAKADTFLYGGPGGICS